MLFITYEPVPEAHDIFKRFAKVFDQTYTRFLDLQKAEAQAREAKIEAALERTRTQSMIMQHSKELDDTLRVFHEQVLLLGIHSAFSFLWLPDEEKDRHIFWAAWAEDKNDSTVFKSKAINYPLDRNEPATAQCLVDWKSNEPVVSYHVPPAAVENYFAAWQELIDGVEQLKPEYFSDGLYYVEAFMKYGCFGVMVATDLTEDEKKILGRFAIEFERTYTRFLDLQKAEAQAREAQIEAALERVRSKTMAMHNSNDVGETVAAMFAEFVHLGIRTNRCGILIFDDNDSAEVWTARTVAVGKATLIIGKLDLKIYDLLSSAYKSWKDKKPIYQYELHGDDIVRHYEAINRSENYPVKFDMNALPQKEFHSDFFFPEGAVFAFTAEPITDEHSKIMKRFAGVFGQTYRRYLDLQKAEAQAREAQIEASLERVRSKTMAMHNSQDVGDTVGTMFDELVKLGIETTRCGVGIMQDDYQMELWTAKSEENGGVKLIIGTLDMKVHPLLTGVYESWIKKERHYSYELKDEDLIAYYNAINNLPDYPIQYDINSLPSQIFQNTFGFNEGILFAFTPHQLSAEGSQIFKRFAGVFGQTYRRYLDLQKAEAQAREAQIEAGLERVRARTMAMHSSDDVSIATATMFTELEKLGIENFRGGISSIRKNKTQEVWSVNTTPDGRVIRAIGEFDMTLHPFWQQLYIAWENKEELFYFDMSGKEKEDYVRILDARRDYLPNGLTSLPDCHTHGYYFGEGFVWTFSLQPHSEEDKQVMKKFASAFSLTFRRYQDLKKAEAQAREATIEAALERVRGKAMAMHNSNDLSVTASMVFTELRKLGINPIRCGVGLLTKDSRKAQLYSATSSDGWR